MRIHIFICCLANLLWCLPEASAKPPCFMGNVFAFCLSGTDTGGDTASNQVNTLPNLMRVRLQNLVGMSDEAVICLRNGATNLFDSEFDAYKLPGSALYVATRIETGIDLSINCLAPWDSNSPVVPITLLVNSPGPYQLTFTQMDTFYDEINVFLRDNFLNEVVLIKKDTLYNFEVTPNEMSQGPYRFEILFTENIITKEKATHYSCSCKQLEVFPNPSSGYVYIKFKDNNSKQVDIHICDFTGKTAYKASVQGRLLTDTYKLPVKLSAGLYMLTTTTGDGRVQQSKLIVE
jgi:hypothetical protein